MPKPPRETNQQLDADQLSFLQTKNSWRPMDKNTAKFYYSADVLKSLDQLENAGEVLSSLNEVDWSFQKDDTTYLSHDIHPYPAKFIPQIPGNFIVRLSLRGELVWDPFGGSGTTALEAILLGRRALSTDINPLSKVIGSGKTITLTKEDEDDISDLIEELSILSEDANSLIKTLGFNRDSIIGYTPDVPNLNEWFHENAIAELSYILWRIDQLKNPKTQALSKVSLSKSILKASFQDEETRYARRPREIAQGTVLKIFTSNLSLALRKVQDLAPLLQFRKADFRTLDLREQVVGSLPNFPIAPNSVDLVVTSPPYPNSMDYHLYHRFRLFWLGYDPRDMAKREIGSHLRHQKENSAFDSYLSEMRSALINVEKALRPGRYAVFVLGTGIYEGKVYDTADNLAAIAQQIGLEPIGKIERNIHSTKRSFVAPGRRLLTETLLILRKPSVSTEITLIAPPYKLWQYEEVIRHKEIEACTGKKYSSKYAREVKLRIDALKIDKLRRLTFTHAFEADVISLEPTWQAILENGDVTQNKSKRKDPKYVTHGVHDYKGKFYPQLAKSLFNIAKLDPGSKILDPFCGSGTILLESYLNGMSGFGVDMNPLAIRISHAKLGILEVDPYLRDRLLAKMQDKLTVMEDDLKWIRAFPENLHKELLSWFPGPVVGKLGWLLTEISYIPEAHVREFLEVLVSSIVRQISQQEPRDLRIRRRLEPIQDAPVKELFLERVNEQRKRLQQFAERCNRSPVQFVPSHAVLGDSRNASVFINNGIQPETIDAIITSPPYATALPYIDTDRLSILLILGIESSERSQLEESITGSREIKKRAKSEIDDKIDMGDWNVISSPTARDLITNIRHRNLHSDGGFRKQNMAALLYRYFSDMTTVMTNLNTVLKPGASAFFVIGDTRTIAGDKTVIIKSSQVLKEIGESLAWNINEVIPITVTTEDRAHSKNSITENDIIWFKKRQG